MSDLIIEILWVLGFLLIFAGILNITFSNSNSIKKPLVVTVVGALMICSLVVVSTNIGKGFDMQLKEEIASRLDTTTEKIVVKDLSETKGFLISQKRNSRLKEVAFDGQVYLVEVDRNEIVGLSKVN